MVNVRAVKIVENVLKDHFESMASLLPEQSQTEIYSYRNLEDRYRALAARMLLYDTIELETRLKRSEINILRNRYGKPYLGNGDHFHFNLSHSGEWVVCATHDRQLGVDIERQHTVDYLAIARRFFAAEEYGRLMKAERAADLRSLFFEIWTLKESFIKALGVGLSMPLQSFAMMPCEIYGYKPIEAEGSVYYFKGYAVDETYTAAVCSNDVDLPEAITVLTLDELISRLFDSA